MPTQIIRNRWTGTVLHECEAETLRDAIVRAVATGKSLTDAILTDADLRGAVLTDADLRGADLRGAVLTDAILMDADLRGADLRGADLRGADLTDAVLTDADLRGAVLTDAVLTPIRDDLWAVLSSAPAEVEGLREALVSGRVDGSTYDGECACLVGTLANVRHCSYDAIHGLSPNSSRPAERFFLAIRRGDTPATNPFSRLALEWVDEWLERMRSAFGRATAAMIAADPDLLAACEAIVAAESFEAYGEAVELAHDALAKARPVTPTGARHAHPLRLPLVRGAGPDRHRVAAGLRGGRVRDVPSEAGRQRLAGGRAV